MSKKIIFLSNYSKKGEKSYYFLQKLEKEHEKLACVFTKNSDFPKSV